MGCLTFDDDASAQMDPHQLMNKPMNDSEVECLLSLMEQNCINKFIICSLLSIMSINNAARMIPDRRRAVQNRENIDSKSK